MEFFFALGIVVKVDNSIIEDASLWEKDDGQHINVAELKAVNKGISMAVKWNMATMTVYTDSATVYGWVQPVIGDQRLYNRLG